MKSKYEIRGCIGCGVCSGIKPQIFEVDEDGMAEINYQNANDDDVKEASEKCPVQAIKITD